MISISIYAVVLLHENGLPICKRFLSGEERVLEPLVAAILGLAKEMFGADYIPDKVCFKTFTTGYDKVRRIQTGLLTYNILEYIIGVIILTLILIIFLYAHIF